MTADDDDDDDEDDEGKEEEDGEDGDDVDGAMCRLCTWQALDATQRSEVGLHQLRLLVIIAAFQEKKVIQDWLT